MVMFSVRSAKFPGWCAIVACSLLLGGCDPDASPDMPPLSIDARQPAGIEGGPQAAAQGNTSETVLVGSFNIQVFGQSKLNDPAVMRVLTDVARRFDVLAIQEIRSVEQDVIPAFVQQINAGGARYDFVLGPRLGRTRSKEQYAFIYDTTRLEVLPQSVYTADDPTDRLHREPFVATFRVRAPNARPPFTFTLVNAHTDPDEVDTELAALIEVGRVVRQDIIQEDDVILLGDFNTDEVELKRFGQAAGFWPIHRGVTTNTRRTESYDNFLIDPQATAEFTGRFGVLDVERGYQLSPEQALAVSDHLPIWAEFTFTERQGTMATREPAGSTRR